MLVRSWRLGKSYNTLIHACIKKWILLFFWKVNSLESKFQYSSSIKQITSYMFQLYRKSLKLGFFGRKCIFLQQKMQHLFFETIFLKILKSINEPIISFFLLTGKYKAEQMLCDTGLDLTSICCSTDVVRRFYKCRLNRIKKFLTQNRTVLMQKRSFLR